MLRGLGPRPGRLHQATALTTAGWAILCRHVQLWPKPVPDPIHRRTISSLAQLINTCPPGAQRNELMLSYGHNTQRENKDLTVSELWRHIKLFLHTRIFTDKNVWKYCMWMRVYMCVSLWWVMMTLTLWASITTTDPFSKGSLEPIRSLPSAYPTAKGRSSLYHAICITTTVEISTKHGCTHEKNALKKSCLQFHKARTNWV